MFDRYLDRPDATFKSSKSGYLDSFCFAEFLSYYYVHCKSKEEAKNDNEPVVLDDELIKFTTFSNTSERNYFLNEF